MLIVAVNLICKVRNLSHDRCFNGEMSYNTRRTGGKIKWRFSYFNSLLINFATLLLKFQFFRIFLYGGFMVFILGCLTVFIRDVLICQDEILIKVGSHFVVPAPIIFQANARLANKASIKPN